MLEKIKKVVGYIDETIFGITSVVLVMITVVGVFFRFVLNSPFTWVEEVQMILVVWSVFYGASIAIRTHGHIAVEIFYDATPAVIQKVMNVLIWVVVALSIAGITYLQMDRVQDLIKSDLRTPVLRLPSYIEYVGVVIACGLMFVGHILNGFEGLLNLKKEGIEK